MNVLGCSPELTPIRWTGESLVYRAESADTVCAGSFYLQDEYVRSLAELLEVDLERPISFSYVSSEVLEDLCEHETVLGCEFDSDAYSARPMHFHELAHAVARRGEIGGSEALREGFAEALGNGFEPKKLRVPIEPVLRDFAYLDEDYYTAGLFVRFLMERHSLEEVAVLLKRLSRDDSFDAVSAAFADVFEESLAEAMTDFDDYPSCAAWSNRLAFVECGLDAVLWEGNSWQTASDINCSDKDVLGPLVDGQSLVWTTRGLVVDTPGDFVARATGGPTEGDATVRLTRCGSCWDELDVTVSPGSQKQLPLPAGRYYVTLIKELGMSGNLQFSLERVGP